MVLEWKISKQTRRAEKEIEPEIASSKRKWRKMESERLMENEREKKRSFDHSKDSTQRVIEVDAIWVHPTHLFKGFS